MLTAKLTFQDLTNLLVTNLILTAQNICSLLTDKGAMDFSNRLKFTIPRGTPISPAKICLDCICTIIHFTINRRSTSKTIKIIAIFEDVAIEPLVETLQAKRRIALENMIGQSLNLEGPFRTGIELSTNHRKYLRVLPPETLHFNDILRYFHLYGTVNYYDVASPVDKRADGMPYLFFRYRVNSYMCTAMSAIPSKLQPEFFDEINRKQHKTLAYVNTTQNDDWDFKITPTAKTETTTASQPNQTQKNLALLVTCNQNVQGQR